MNIKSFSTLALTLTVAFGAASAAAAQQQRPQSNGNSSTPIESITASRATEALDATKTPAPASEAEEVVEREINSHYRNFLSDYRLGPEDVISVTVFGQERYSKVGITVPPHGKISYPLIPEGILVSGKTTVQIQDELTKRLDEYIIDPKITVSLDQARSTRYAVLGDVLVPGVKPMLRRLTVREAVAEAGGVTSQGSKTVQLLRMQQGGMLTPIKIDIAAIEKGKKPDDMYLQPGDQIIVPGNKLKKIQQIANIASLVSFAGWFIRW